MARSTQLMLPLRVVPMTSIIPHEQVDIRRVQRLKQRLQTEAVLRDPLIVTSAGNHYVVLDGATRTMALRELGYQAVIVQVIPPSEIIALHTWNHVLMGLEANDLLDLLGNLPEISRSVTENSLFEADNLAILQLSRGEFYAITLREGHNPLTALHHLTESYMSVAQVQRTSDSDLMTLQEEFPTMTGVMIFPEFTVSQVLQVALTGQFFPAGITRFIIPKRVLRLNADLAMLRSAHSLAEKNEWLHDLLAQKFSQGQIRYYEESVYLLDG